MLPFVKRIIVALLLWEARGIVKRYRPRIVAVTGSVGKTMTKDAIFAVLATNTYVRKSEKSYNSEVGVPLTILGRPTGWYRPSIWLANLVEGLGLLLLRNHYPATLVLEIGADRPGDIKRITSWLTPDVVVVTRFPDVPAHIEFFDSREALFEEKAALVRSLPSSGVLVYNADDVQVRSVAEEFRGERIGYGFLPGARFIARDDELVYDEEGKLSGMRFRLEEGSRSVPVEVHGTVGRQSIYSALAAIAVGSVQGVTLIGAGEALAGNEPTAGRMRVLMGIKETTLIDDTYNASPAAMEEALETLRRAETSGRKIVVVGDMLELGEHTTLEHEKVGARAAEVADLLLTVGIRARSCAEGALSAGMHDEQILQYENARAAGKELQGLLQAGDLVLVKGSQRMRMERIVEEVMAEPEKKDVLLVRQDPEWLARP